MKKILLFFIILICRNISADTGIDTWTLKYDSILKKYVKPGIKKNIKLTLVDYYGLSKDNEFHQLYKELENIDLSGANKNTKLSFWINAYNYLTLYIISKNPGIKSIKDIGNIFKNVWQQPAGKVAGEILTLDNIEHDIIRKKFNEPLIHFSLVCASLSCPDLRPEAYTGDKLDEQLKDQTIKFLNNKEKGLSINYQLNTIYLTRLFLWYGKDFQKKPDEWLYDNGFINKNELKYNVKYLNYDWDLNIQ